jgi:hypothetical protein
MILFFVSIPVEKLPMSADARNRDPCAGDRAGAVTEEERDDGCDAGR